MAIKGPLGSLVISSLALVTISLLHFMYLCKTTFSLATGKLPGGPVNAKTNNLKRYLFIYLFSRLYFTTNVIFGIQEGLSFYSGNKNKILQGDSKAKHNKKTFLIEI